MWSRKPERNLVDGSLKIFSSHQGSPERVFLQEMKTTIGKLEWESSHCLRLETAIQWGKDKANGNRDEAWKHRSGLVEGAVDELTEAEILVDLERAQRLAFAVADYLNQQDESGCSGCASENVTSISPLCLYLRRLDVFRAHVRKSVEQDVVKGFVIPADESRICSRLKEYDAREADRGHERPFSALENE